MWLAVCMVDNIGVLLVSLTAIFYFHFILTVVIAILLHIDQLKLYLMVALKDFIWKLSYYFHVF